MTRNHKNSKRSSSNKEIDYKGIALLLVVVIMGYIIYTNFTTVIIGSLLLAIIVVAGIAILAYYGGLAALASALTAIGSILASLITLKGIKKGRGK